MPRLLFVCTGNTCRSPLAAAIAGRMAEAAGVDLQVESAGISAVDSAPASGHAQFVALDRDLDLAAHRSRRLDEHLLRESDLVITMTVGHRDAIRGRWPDHAARVVTLAEAAGRHEDVDDPFGGDLESYERAADQIDALLRAAWPEIERRLGA